MNHFKSLSDSSTSESEEDGRRLQNSYTFDIQAIRKRVAYGDMMEDEHAGLFSPPKQQKMEFKNPAKYIERELSDSESDDKNSLKSPLQTAPNMPTKEILNGSYGVGMKLMEKMGYKSGTGLGKYEQGRVDIVHASKQRGRRGLGLHIAGLEPSEDTTWDFSRDEVSIKEDIEWMPDCKTDLPNIQTLREWIQEGEPIEKIDDQINFCDPEILHTIIEYKSVFDQLDGDEMRKARTRSNPFETIRGGIFLNRAAMKMANMDAAFDFMFTNPQKMNGEPVVSINDLLYFADICAGPGGFSEYVLWRKKWESKGFGFTLKGPNDFKLEDFFAGPPESFEPYYGIKDDGNIYDPDNLRDFKKFVLANTDDKGVHFVMADGGFSVDGRENEQEILSKRLYLCQFLCALLILRPGGHFVCKLFDLFTCFSVGLVYLMYHAFEKVCIFKPNTSRPANSERYIICKWLKEDTKDICDYMYEVNCLMDKYSNSSETDIIEVVPLSILKSDEEFYEYIVNSNNILGARQIIHLDKIRVFTKNTELHDERQNDFRKECLELWKVPDKARSAPSRPEVKALFETLMQGENLNILQTSSLELTESTLQNLESIFEFYCVVCGESKPENTTLFISLGRSNVYQLDIKHNKWNKVDGTLEIPAKTLFFGELVSELKGEFRAQKKITSLHIIDAICLGGQDVKKYPFSMRMQLARKLVKAVFKPSKPNFMPLRVKHVYKLQNIQEAFQNLSVRVQKNHKVKLCYEVDDGKYIIPLGLLIFKTVKEPWTIAYSKSQRKTYIFNTKRNISSYQLIDEANADFLTCYKSRIFWTWGPDVYLTPEQDCDGTKESVIHSHTLTSFVKKNLNRIMGIHS